MVVKRNQSPIAEARALEREQSPFVEEKYPSVERMVIRMTYYQKGENPVLMNRMINVYPDTDHAYFLMPCMIRDCEAGGFDMGPLIASMVKKKEKEREGSMMCMEKEGELPPDHASIKYRIEIKYWKGGKRPAVKKAPPVEEQAPAASRKKVAVAEKRPSRAERLSAMKRAFARVRKPAVVEAVEKEKGTAGKEKATPKKPAAKKPVPKKPAAKKPVPKKPAAKKPVPKKPAVKKPVPKKPAAKKPATKKPLPKKSAAKKPATKKPLPKKPAVKKPVPKKPAAKKSPVKKAASKKASAKPSRKKK